MRDFKFKQFNIKQDLCAMKVGTDGVLLGSWAVGGERILDIGTGTGLIALMMAQRFAAASVTAIDIDHNACSQATMNVQASVFKERIKVIETPLQHFADERPKSGTIKYDSIVSNPPFFTNSLKNPDQARAIARHADTLSYADLFRGVSLLLSDDGEFSAIIPADCLNAFMAEGYIFGLSVKRKYTVRTVVGKQPKRNLISFCNKHIYNTDIQDVNLLDNNGNRSDWYNALTKDFYL